MGINVFVPVAENDQRRPSTYSECDLFTCYTICGHKHFSTEEFGSLSHRRLETPFWHRLFFNRLPLPWSHWFSKQTSSKGCMRGPAYVSSINLCEKKCAKLLWIVSLTVTFKLHLFSFSISPPFFGQLDNPQTVKVDGYALTYCESCLFCLMPNTAHFSLFRVRSRWKEPFWSIQYIIDYYSMSLQPVCLHSLHPCIVHLKDLSRRGKGPAVPQLRCGPRWTKADWSWTLSTCSSTVIWWLWCALWEMKCSAEILRMLEFKWATWYCKSITQPNPTASFPELHACPVVWRVVSHSCFLTASLLALCN